MKHTCSCKSSSINIYSLEAVQVLKCLLNQWLWESSISCVLMHHNYSPILMRPRGPPTRPHQQQQGILVHAVSTARKKHGLSGHLFSLPCVYPQHAQWDCLNLCLSNGQPKSKKACVGSGWRRQQQSRHRVKRHPKSAAPSAISMLFTSWKCQLCFQKGSSAYQKMPGIDLGTVNVQSKFFPTALRPFHAFIAIIIMFLALEHNRYCVPLMSTQTKTPFGSIINACNVWHPSFTWQLLPLPQAGKCTTCECFWWTGIYESATLAFRNTACYFTDSLVTCKEVFTLSLAFEGAALVSVCPFDSATLEGSHLLLGTALEVTLKVCRGAAHQKGFSQLEELISPNPMGSSA